MIDPSPFFACARRVREFIRHHTSTARRSPTAVGSEEVPFNHLALELFRLQFDHIEPYQRLVISRGLTPGDVLSWREIPAVPAAAFKGFDLTSLTPAERIGVFHSSGTTGQQPTRHFHNVESLAVYAESLGPWFAAHLLSNPNERPVILSLTPPADQAPHSSLAYMTAIVIRHFGGPGSEALGSVAMDGSWTLDGARIAGTLRQFSVGTRPVAVLGTAFSFVHLIDQLDANAHRLALPAGSRVMETGGYKGRSRSMPKADLHTLIADRLGVPRSSIVCEYGMSELGSQAYDRSVQDEAAGSNDSEPPPTFRFPPWARAVMVSPETGREVGLGECGLLRIVDLANVYSVLAVQTGDLAIRRPYGFELQGREALAEPRGCSLLAS